MVAEYKLVILMCLLILKNTSINIAYSLVPNVVNTFSKFPFQKL